MSEVRIYDLEDRYIMTVPADNVAVCSYNSSKEKVKDAASKTKRFRRTVKEYEEKIALAECDRRTALELTLKEAERNKAEYTGKANPTVIEVVRANEEPLFKKVVGGADLDTMNRNAARRQKGEL